jgi:transposase
MSIIGIRDILNCTRSEQSAYPSVLCLDSQSIKLAPMIFEVRGIGSNKKVNGRKRQVLVDCDGRLWRVCVHAANEHDGPAGCALLKDTSFFDKYVKKILGDQAYKGAFAKYAGEKGFIFECATRPESAKGFVPIAKRWVVERSIAWTNFFRRIVKDYEYTVQSSVNWLILANMTIMLQRINT